MAIVIISAILVIGLIVYLMSSNDTTQTSQSSYASTPPQPAKKKLSCSKCTSENVGWAHANKDGMPDLRYANNYLVCRSCKHAERYRNK